MGIGAGALMAISSVAQIGGGIIGAMGSIQEGNYRAQVAENNAKIADWNAGKAIEAGEVNAANQGLKTRSIIGAQKAAQGASGLDVNVGSAVDVRAATDMLGMTDALTVKADAAKEAYGFKTQQTQFLADAAESRFAGRIGALSSLISGFGSVASGYAKWQAQYG